jgi:protein involved in sex pheromone biosynthesis
MENEKRYNVYIMSDAGKAQALIGSDMNERQADKRVMSGLMRIDRDNFFVADYEVGSEADWEAKKQLTKK